MYRKYFQTLFLAFCFILPVLLLLIIRTFSHPSYFFSSLYKVVFLFPFLYFSLFEIRSFRIKVFSGFSVLQFKKHFLSAFLWGISFSAIYAFAFFLFRPLLSGDVITSALNSFAAITSSNILLIGLYIIFVNSLLEEFFWRGFFFVEVSSLYGKVLGYIFTGIGFSLYHIAFFYSWFSLPFVLLAALGLFCYSLFMCFLFERYKDLFTCWFIHGLVDIVQIFIALYLFGILS